MPQRQDIIDITVLLGEESIDYPGDRPFSITNVESIESGDRSDLSFLSLSAHAGTHIDSPSHFIKGGKRIDEYLVRDFILPAEVIEVEDRDVVKPGHLSGHEINPGDAVLFRTHNSRTGICRNGRFSEGYVYLSSGAAEACVEKEVSLVGIDYISVDRHGDESFSAHKILMRAGILVLEGIDLIGAQPGRYILHCLPLKLRGVEASPVRAVLLS